MLASRPIAFQSVRPRSTFSRAVQPLVRPSRLCVFAQASSEPATATAPVASAPIPVGPPSDYVEDNDFSISKVSFGSILTPVGSGLLLFGFGAYFQFWGGGDLSSIALVYGLLMALLGFALSYAQLEPVQCKTNKAALPLRDTQMTDIQKQVREDTTRFRYGDEQHLEEALDRIFRFGKSGGIPRKFSPVLKGLREEVVDGAYTLILDFDTTLEQAVWEEKQPKFQSFFGPGIIARVARTGDNSVEVALISDGTGAGRGGNNKKDVLPPLMPGLKPRQQ